MKIEATTIEELLTKLHLKFPDTEWEICDFDSSYLSVLDNLDNFSVNHYKISKEGECFVLSHEF